MGRSATNVFANALTSAFIDKWDTSIDADDIKNVDILEENVV